MSYDEINRPEHYEGCAMSVRDVIAGFKLNFFLGSAVKYILRCDKKGYREMDIRKAIRCLQIELGECDETIDSERNSCT